ncbi:hypothetical protein ACTMTI_48235 [Nonomuraea sp. H19]|uniref:hypothetical protein n=1 Tax=Nonomuraea sp. H19 TaxID=3452206 RepID=UPI003F8C9B55
MVPLERAIVPQVIRNHHPLYEGTNDELLDYIDDRLAATAGPERDHDPATAPAPEP